MKNLDTQDVKCVAGGMNKNDIVNQIADECELVPADDKTASSDAKE